MTPEEFLTHEAWLLDEMRYSDWYALWKEGGTYWIPINAADEDPRRQVSIVHDDYSALGQRVERLNTGAVLAVQEVRGAMRRLVSNVEVADGADGTTRVGSNFLIGIARTSEQQFWMGRSIHTLARDGDGYRILSKKVLLINSMREIPLLQFLI